MGKGEFSYRLENFWVRHVILLSVADMGCLFSCRLNFSTAFSSNAVSICNSIGLYKVKRIEVSTRYLIHWEQDGLAISPVVEEEVHSIHDRNKKITSVNRSATVLVSFSTSKYVLL